MKQLNSNNIIKTVGSVSSTLYNSSEEIGQENLRLRKPRNPNRKPGGLFRVQNTWFWRTNEDEQREIALCNMETRHLLNCAKMMYNGVALRHGLPTVRLVSASPSSNSLTDQRLLLHVSVLLEELKTRQEAIREVDFWMMVNTIRAIIEKQDFNHRRLSE